MTDQPRPTFPLDEYAIIEQMSGLKHEYVAGVILAMPGAGPVHDRIAGNLVHLLRPQLAGGPGQVFGSDVRIGVTAAAFYTYPDVSVICGALAAADMPRHTVLNPTVLFEVLSPSTADYDRVTKLAYYTQLPSLVAYVLVAQDRRWVAVHTRAGAAWPASS